MLKFGDIAERWLSAAGITKQRVQLVSGSKGCGCAQRQEALNQFGYRFQMRVANYRHRLRYTWQRIRHNSFTARIAAYWQLQVMAFRALFQRA